MIIRVFLSAANLLASFFFGHIGVDEFIFASECAEDFLSRFTIFISVRVDELKIVDRFLFRASFSETYPKNCVMLPPIRQPQIGYLPFCL